MFASYNLALGLADSDLPRALLVVHELLGAAFLFGVWAACYRVRPSARVLRLQSPLFKPAADRMQAPSSSRLLQRVQAALAKAPLPDALRPDPLRLAVSCGEGAVLRQPLRVVTVPGKVWLTATGIQWWKGASSEARTAVGAGEATGGKVSDR